MSVVRQSIEWLGCGQKGLVMESVQNATEVFDQVYLDIRAGLLVLAASLDRVDRSEGAEVIGDDLRRERIQQGLEILSGPGLNRAEQIQVLFSDPYRSGWNTADANETSDSPGDDA